MIGTYTLLEILAFVMILIQISSSHGIELRLDRKNTPPPGGFPIYYVPSSRTLSKRTLGSTWYKFFEGGPLIHGS